MRVTYFEKFILDTTGRPFCNFVERKIGCNCRTSYDLIELRQCLKEKASKSQVRKAFFLLQASILAFEIVGTIINSTIAAIIMKFFDSLSKNWFVYDLTCLIKLITEKVFLYGKRFLSELSRDLAATKDLVFSAIFGNMARRLLRTIGEFVFRAAIGNLTYKDFYVKVEREYRKTLSKIASPDILEALKAEMKFYSQVIKKASVLVKYVTAIELARQLKQYPKETTAYYASTLTAEIVRKLVYDIFSYLMHKFGNNDFMYTFLRIWHVFGFVTGVIGCMLKAH